MTQQINLFNPAFSKQEAHFTLLPMLQGLALILLVSLLFYAYAAHQVSELDKQSVQSSKHLIAEQANLAGYTAGYSPQQANQLLQNELLQLEKKLAETSLFVESLKSGVTGNTTGYSEYMRAFSRQIMPGLWLTGFNMSGEQISLTGGVIAPEHVPAYIQKLASEAVMQGKSFSNLQMNPKKDSKYMEFTLHSTPGDEVKP
jgi:Tfp pilus assembly protein PilN